MSGAFTNGFSAKIGDGGGPEVFTKIPECFGVSPIGATRDLIDVTNFDSNGSREYIAGLKDGSEFNLDMNYLPDNTIQDQARSDADNGTKRNFEIEFTDGTNTQTFSFAAIGVGWNKGPSTDDKATAQVTFKITGTITLT